MADDDFRVPYITDRRRQYLESQVRRGFQKVARAETDRHVVLWKKFAGNSASSAAFGDTLPVFDDPVDVDAVVQDAPDKQKLIAWGMDERTERIIYVLAEFVTENTVTGRDRFDIDGEDFEVLDIHMQEGIGHERATVPITLTRQTQEAWSG